MSREHEAGQERVILVAQYYRVDKIVSSERVARPFKSK
jgi:hypothetical protein